MKIKAQRYRDGTTQGRRIPAALDPEYIAADERTAEDLLKFARAYAEKLRFYSADNKEAGNWSALFEDDVREMAAFMKNPEQFAREKEKMQRFSRPHLVLFLAFLRLLRHPQQQFRALTTRHLEFYYKEVLKLQEKPAVPDHVHVIFVLARDVDTHRVNQGTLLRAGKDSQGIDIHYATDEELIVNRAQVARVNTLHVRKTSVGLKDIHKQEGFEMMLRWALGRPNQGDPLPTYPDGSAGGTPVDVTYLTTLYQEIKDTDLESIDPGKKDYILQQLCFAELDEFKYCMEILEKEEQEEEPSEAEWKQVYERIETAYKKNINRKRRETLKNVREGRITAGDDENTAFTRMMEFALGDPNPGDPLPPMPGSYATLDDLFSKLSEPSVAGYVKDELRMSVEDFQKIMAMKESSADWDELYRLVATAQVKKRNLSYPPIGRTEIQNVYATPILEAKQGEAVTSKRFKTFLEIPQTAPHPVMGCAIASPVLLVQEGERTITLTVACKMGTLKQEKLQAILQKDTSPFELSLSSRDTWVKLESPEIRVGNFIVEDAINTYDVTDLDVTPQDESSPILCIANKETFHDSDKNKCIVSTNKIAYEIINITEAEDEQHVELQAIDTIDIDKTPVNAVTTTRIYLNSLQFRLTLDKTAPAVSPSETDSTTYHIQSKYPVLKILLKNIPKDDDQEEWITPYEQVKDIMLEKINIRVDVKDLQALRLRNDSSVLSPKSPFEPFDSLPKPGSGFYIANPELCGKKLDALSLNIDWMGLPENFETHYNTYSKLFFPSEDPLKNASFTAQLKLLIKRSWVEIGDAKALFTSDSLNYTRTNFDDPNYNIDLPSTETEIDDPLEMPRYFKLELEAPDFQHEIYPIALTKVALATDEDVVKDKFGNDTNIKIKSLTVYPPYTPKIKAIAANYTSSAEIDLSDQEGAEKRTTRVHTIFQLHPFGYVDLLDTPEESKRDYSLMPQYDNEGDLFLGLSDLKPPQHLAMLFQLVAGSGNPDLENPGIHWSYLSHNRWNDFKKTELLSDGTNGLLDTGIIRLGLPGEADDRNTLLPAGMHWLRAAVQENAAAIPDTLDIKTQALRATFHDQGNAPDHLSKPLSAHSIQDLAERDPAIHSVSQPYSSVHGKMPEEGLAFYTRVSEGLRHKQRALSTWDYERLVLERFPQIYNVKCLNQADLSQPGQDHDPASANVTVVVVPDIADTSPFFPLEPKVPQYVLQEIEAYLQAQTSPFVQVTVKNPRYERIKCRVAVRFKPGYDQGDYLRRLNEEIKEFLSPWAYTEHAPISFGRSIHSSAVIYFIETREYVDYVASLKLIEQVPIHDGDMGGAETSMQSTVSTVHHPDAILISSPQHILDLITTEEYEEEEFEGIGYMLIGIDFIVK